MTAPDGGSDMDCEELVELVTDYLEAVLDPDTRARVERHLAGCDGCTAYLEQMRTTIVLLGQLPPDELDAPSRDRLLHLFRAWAGDAR